MTLQYDMSYFLNYLDLSASEKASRAYDDTTCTVVPPCDVEVDLYILTSILGQLNLIHHLAFINQYLYQF